MQVLTSWSSSHWKIEFFYSLAVGFPNRRQILELTILVSLGKLSVFCLLPFIAGSSHPQETQDPAYNIP